MDGARTLRSYANLSTSNGLVTKSKVYVDKPALDVARRVFIVGTSFSSTSATAIDGGDRILISNAIDRALCANLSEKFEIVSSRQQADLTVRAVVSHVALTNEIAAGASKGLSVAGTALGLGGVAPGAGLVPRIPYGLGGLSVEAEALDGRGRQRAGMVWTRGASVMGSDASVSSIGDAYLVAGKFGEDFGQMIVTGESPFGRFPSFMSRERIHLAVGLNARHSACVTYGRGPGIAGALGAVIGLPPDITDSGAKIVQ